MEEKHDCLSNNGGGGGASCNFHTEYGESTLTISVPGKTGWGGITSREVLFEDGHLIRALEKIAAGGMSAEEAAKMAKSTLMSVKRGEKYFYCVGGCGGYGSIDNTKVTRSSIETAPDVSNGDSGGSRPDIFSRLFSMFTTKG